VKNADLGSVGRADFFSLHLLGADRRERIDRVTSFVGEDESGSFGILAGHTRLMTSLVFGLARFRIGDDSWRYLAMPGALLYFIDNELSISTERYIISDDYEKISTLLERQLVAEQAARSEIKRSLQQMEQELLKRLWQGDRDGKSLL